MKLSTKIKLYGLAGALSYVAYELFINMKPKRAFPVENFDVERYMGKWYEIARLPLRFEKKMIYTTANYSLNQDGSVKVVNSGYKVTEDEWKTAEGRAIFRGDTSRGALKVSFFGPFYTGYNVVALDDDYQYALVIGRSTDYAWILSRNRTIPDDVLEQYLGLAAYIGVDLGKLIWVPQL